MPFLITGTDRQTARPTRFLSNAVGEALARESAEGLGVVVASVAFVQEHTPQNVAGMPIRMPAPGALVPPSVQWSGEWETPAGDGDPVRRRIGKAVAAVGLILVGLCLADLWFTVPAYVEMSRDRERYLKVHGGNHWLFPASAKAERDDLRSIRIDGFIGLAGLILLTGGLHWERTHRGEPASDESADERVFDDPTD
jgi:hypothetical protein